MAHMRAPGERNKLANVDGIDYEIDGDTDADTQFFGFDGVRIGAATVTYTDDEGNSVTPFSDAKSKPSQNGKRNPDERKKIGLKKEDMPASYGAAGDTEEERLKTSFTYILPAQADQNEEGNTDAAPSKSRADKSSRQDERKKIAKERGVEYGTAGPGEDVEVFTNGFSESGSHVTNLPDEDAAAAQSLVGRGFATKAAAPSFLDRFKPGQSKLSFHSTGYGTSKDVEHSAESRSKFDPKKLKKDIISAIHSMSKEMKHAYICSFGKKGVDKLHFLTKPETLIKNSVVSAHKAFQTLSKLVGDLNTLYREHMNGIISEIHSEMRVIFSPDVFNQRLNLKEGLPYTIEENTKLLSQQIAAGVSAISEQFKQLEESARKVY